MTQPTACDTTELSARVQALEHYIYRAFDDRGRLLYVGCTSDVDARWDAHRRGSEWFPRATRRTISEPDSFDGARAGELQAILTEHPMFNMNEPCRGRVRSARSRVQATAVQMASRDGWQMNDAHAIGESTASLIAPDLKKGTPFSCFRKWELLARHEWFQHDPLPFVFTGYRLLVASGWEPECSPSPRFHFIPRSWDTSIHGHIARDVARIPQAH